MGKLFEASFKVGYTFYERTYDTSLGKSISEEITLPSEWYEPSPKGIYSFILDESLKLEKRQGNPRHGRDKHGFLDPAYRNIRDNYWNKGLYNLKPRIMYLDIETRAGTNSHGFPVPEKALEPISLFQMYDSKTDSMIILGLKDWTFKEKYEFPYPVKYMKCSDEIHLIETFLKVFKKLDPLAIYAWNGSGFDFPYIHNRMKKLGMNTNKLSNYGEVRYSEFMDDKGKLNFKFSSDGHFFIDLEDVYKKFILDPRPNYKLDTIADIELGKRKVSHSEYVRFDDFYTGNYTIPDNPSEDQKNSEIYKAAISGDWDTVKELAHSEFIYYGCVDTYLIKEIDDKRNLTQLMLMIAEKMGVQMSDSLGTVKPWSQYILNTSMTNLKVMPPRKDNPNPDVVGGFVREPVLGKHLWVLSEDVSSMYPLLGMVGFNMSPETFIPKSKLPPELRDLVLSYFNDQDEDKRLNLSDEVWDSISVQLKKNNMSLGINGAVFSRDKLGIIPELVLDIYNSRKASKKKMKNYEKRKVLIKEILKGKKNDKVL